MKEIIDLFGKSENFFASLRTLGLRVKINECACAFGVKRKDAKSAKTQRFLALIIFRRILMNKFILPLILSVFVITGNVYGQSEEELNKALIEALEQKNIVEIRRLLGLDDDFREKYIWSSDSFYSVISKDLELFKAASGFIDYKNRDYILSYIVDGGNLDVLKYALDKFGKQPVKPGNNTPYLIIALEQDNLEMFNMLIDIADVNVPDLNLTKTALMVAAQKGDTESMLALINRGADVNVCFSCSYDGPLFSAIEGGHAGAVELLLANGAKFDNRRSYRQSNYAVFLAAGRGYTGIIKHLAEAGYAIDEPNFRASPLAAAVKNGHYETAAYLLEKGANPVARIENYYEYYPYTSPFAIAAGEGYMDILEMFIKHYNYDPARETYFTDALTFASNNGQVEAVRRLLETGIQPAEPQFYIECAVRTGKANSVTFWLSRGGNADAVFRENYQWLPSFTLLEEAAVYGHTGVVKVLVEHGACITPEVINRAVAQGDAGMVEFLVANGAEIKPEHLISAAGHQKPDIVRLLLSYGLEADYRNRFLRTPLIEATMFSYNEMEEGRPFSGVAKQIYETSKLLIEHGADVNARDFEGMTPLMFAVSGGYAGTIKLLLSHGARLNDTNNFGDKVTCFFHPHNNPENNPDTVLMKLLKISYTPEDIKNGFQDYQMQIKRKWQYEKDYDLLSAISGKDTNAIKRAIGAGADINYYNDGISPMNNALNGGSTVAVLRLLVENGAPVNTGNGNGTTPLMRAVMAGDYSACEYFINQGADVNQMNIYNNTALTFAAKNGDLKMIKLLVEKGADVNMGGKGKYLLNLAAEYEHTEAVELLKSFGIVDE